MRDLEPVLTEYVYDLKAQNRAAGTIRNYLSTLRLWASEVGNGVADSPETVADVRKEHIAPWLAGRQELEAPGTVLSRYRHLRGFFKWAEREEIIDRSPMFSMSEPSSPQNPPPVLTTEQLKAIFDTTRADKSFNGVRDFALILTLADTGMRVGELVGIEVDDIDFDHGTIEVTGKGNRRRRVAFHARTGKTLLAYLRARAKHKDADCAQVWIGARGPLHEAAVWTIVKRRGEAAGVDGVFPHLFRHTMAHRFRLSGGQEGDLASLGGWRSPAMLARYGASAASERAIEAHRRVDHLGDAL